MPKSMYPKKLGKWFLKNTGEELDLENPKSFNHKIQWLKLYDSTPDKGRLADKYLVRKWIEEQIGSEYLIPLLGVWDNPSDIDFDLLPDCFVLKATHGSKWNILVSNKEKLDKQKTSKMLKKWLRLDYGFYSGLELHYHYCKPRIIAEAYLKETVGPNLWLGGLLDYKVYVFNTSHVVILVCAERENGRANKKIYYDESWTKIDLAEVGADNNIEIEKPMALEEMIRLSRKLASGFSFVRIDWYVINGRLYFGEMTFTPRSGRLKFVPPKWNEIFGSWIELPSAKSFDKNL